MEHKQIVALLAYNHPGVLLRIIGLFTRRGFNIDNITAGVTQDNRFSRVTIVMEGDDSVARQVVHQVMKVEDVTQAVILPEKETVCCELMLIKVRVAPSERPAIFQAALTYHATVVDVGQHTMTLQATAMPNELDELIKSLREQGILELARTGMTALQAGDGMLSLQEEDKEQPSPAHPA